MVAKASQVRRQSVIPALSATIKKPSSPAAFIAATRASLSPKVMYRLSVVVILLGLDVRTLKGCDELQKVLAPP